MDKTRFDILVSYLSQAYEAGQKGLTFHVKGAAHYALLEINDLEMSDYCYSDDVHTSEGGTTTSE